jgi:nitrogen regulatory protein PII
MMYHMVMLIINNLDECDPVLDAWEAVGVGGITILESGGLGRARQAATREDLPLMPRLADFFHHAEHRHRTIFTVVDDEKVVDRLLEVTEQIVGDLDEPDNGILFVLPVVRVKGLAGGQQRAQQYKRNG